MSIGQAVPSDSGGVPYPFLQGGWVPEIPQAIAAGWRFPRHPNLRTVQTKAKELRELLESVPRLEVSWIVASPAQIAQQEVDAQEILEGVETLMGLLTGHLFQRIGRDVRRWAAPEAARLQRVVDKTLGNLREDRESLLFILDRPPAGAEWLPEPAPIGSFGRAEDAQPVEPP